MIDFENLNNDSRDAEDQRRQEEDFGESCIGQVRTKLWNFLEYPETSLGAQALAFLSLLMVCISTITFIIGTNYEGEQEKKLRMTTMEMEDTEEEDNQYNLNIIEIIDNIAVIFFSVEFFMRQ